MNDITLSPDQTASIAMALEAIEANEPCLIDGRAGTGKTTTLKGLVDQIKSRGYPYQLVAFTNKAADVVRKKLHIDERDATTSHRLLYQTEMRIRIGTHLFEKKVGRRILDELAAGEGMDEARDAIFYSVSVELVADGVGASDESIDKEINARIHDMQVAYKQIDYGEEAVTSRIETPNPSKVIICDEVSMLPKTDMDNILETYKRVIFVGDYRQLPPVNSPDTIFELMRMLEPHRKASLTTVFRSGDVILDLAEKAEHGKPLGGETIDRVAFTALVNEGAKFILPTNKMVFKANAAARRVQGLSGPPRIGEPLMTVRRCQAFLPSYEKGSHALHLKLNSQGFGGANRFDAWPTSIGPDGKRFVDYDRFPRKRKARNNLITCMPINEFHNTLFFVKEYVTIQKSTEIVQNGTAFKYVDPMNSAHKACIPIDHNGEKAFLPTMDFWNLSMEQWDRERASGDMTVFFSYAITVHKSQGSEYPVVVVQPKGFGDDRERSNYTAITRAKDKCVIAKRFRL